MLQFLMFLRFLAWSWGTLRWPLEATRVQNRRRRLSILRLPVLFKRWFLDVGQLQTHHIQQLLVTFQRKTSVEESAARFVQVVEGNQDRQG